ncbi:heavy metal translocating P-type ATPase [Patescibacteria group bacterium]
MEHSNHKKTHPTDLNETRVAHNHSSHHAMMANDFKRRFWISLIIVIPVLILSPTVQGWLSIELPEFTGQNYLLFVLASIIALWGAKPFYSAAKDEIKSRLFGMMTLVSLAVLSGYLYSVATTFFIEAPDFYWEISTLALFLLFGHWMEMKSVVKSSGALQELLKLIPPQAHKIVNNQIKDVATIELVVGDIMLVKPGEKIPTDGKVIEGSSGVNESMISGESKPVAKTISHQVIGGSINLDGSLTVEVTKVGRSTALAQIVAMVQQAQMSKPKSQRLADRAAKYLTLIAIVIGIGTFVYWSVFTTQGGLFALTLSITVIVITCPHALGLAIPTVTSIASTMAAKNGLLIRDMNSLEKAQRLTHIIFDKTGTLTKGKFGVTDILSIKVNDDNLLSIAAVIESHSEHTIAQGIVNEARSKSLKLPAITNFAAVPGFGARGIINNQEYVVGNRLLMKQFNISITELEERYQRLASQGKTVVYVADSSKILGIIALADVIKTEAKQAVKALIKNGIEVVMLSGDNEQTAKAVADVLGIKTYFAEVKPETKAQKVQSLQQMGNVVAMVGDGINDAPALKQADVGIAIGAGTDVAAASADVLLVQNNPYDVVKLIKLSRFTNSKMKQNLAWATGYNIIAIPVAAGVLFGIGFTLRPEWGALIMAASSIIVVANALTLRTKKLAE